MNFVYYKDIRYEIDDYNRLVLSGLGIEDLSEIQGLDTIKNVKTLFLQNNKIKRIRNLENLTELKALYLYNNEIERIENLSLLTKLRKLILNNNKIVKIEGLENLENLVELDLGNNQIEKIEGIESLVKLEYLALYGNRIKEIEGLDSASNLRILYLNNNSIKEIKGLENLVNLQEFYLNYNEISEIVGLEKLDKLNYLRIDSNPIQEPIIEDLNIKDGIIYKPRVLVEYCKKQKEQELIELKKEIIEDKKEIQKIKFKEFNEKFERLKEKWYRFVNYNTYLIYDKKNNFIRKLKEISKFPFYYRLIYPFRLKKIRKIGKDFEHDILNYNQRFIERRLNEYQSFFEGKKYNIKYPLDIDQRIAIIKDDKHNLIIAGAGSGKTSVIISRIAYLLERRDKVNKEKILALAFTNVAAREMRERLKKIYNIDIEISTFHALGRKIIKMETKQHPKLVSGVSEIIKEIFNNLLNDKRFLKLFLDYLSYHTEEEIEEESFEDKELYYKYMRNKKYTTLNNIEVKSISEKDIANFLFIHGIKFRYEPLVEWADHDEDFDKEYHPDFYLPEYDIYIEHWGLNRDFEVPEWFTLTSKEYCQKREWKLAQFEKHQKLLIETWEYERIEGNLISNLKSKLKKINSNIAFKPLSLEELIQRVSDFKNKKNDIITLIDSFIRIAKSNFLMEDDIEHRLKYRKYSNKQKAFGKIAILVYKKYQNYLKKEKKIDFNDMINLAVELIERNPEKYRNIYEHILIDEFQDISYQRMKLIKCFVNDKSKTKLFCVGDDWQSIYQFTGSDVNYFINFEQYFSEPEKTFLKRNYRSARNIVNISNHIMSQKRNQIKKKIYSYAKIDSKKILYFQINQKFTKSDKIDPYLIYNFIKSLMNSGAKPEEIMVISRFNYNLKKIKIYCGAHNIPIEEKEPRGQTIG
ncbi:MAG: UvrD-helicase domain-containing protein, partial [Promethearchaeia archaeon]